jgi:hypothetical protein
VRVRHLPASPPQRKLSRRLATGSLPPSVAQRSQASSGGLLRLGSAGSILSIFLSHTRMPRTRGRRRSVQAPFSAAPPRAAPCQTLLVRFAASNPNHCTRETKLLGHNQGRSKQRALRGAGRNEVTDQGVTPTWFYNVRIQWSRIAPGACAGSRSDARTLTRPPPPAWAAPPPPPRPSCRSR